MATVVAAAFDALIRDTSGDAMLTAPQLRKILCEVADRHREKLTKLAYLDRRDPYYDAEEALRETQVMAHAYDLLASQGVAALIEADDPDRLQSLGLTDRRVTEINAAILMMRRQDLIPTRPGKLIELLSKLGFAADDPIHIAQAQTAYFAGLSRALQDFLEAWPDIPRPSADTPVAPPASPTEDRSPGEQPSPLRTASPSILPDAQPPATQDAPRDRQAAIRQILGQTNQESSSSSVEYLLERLIESKKKTSSWGAKSCRQAGQTVSLFVRITDVRDLAEVRQRDLALFKDVLLSIPTHYDKSSASRGLSIEVLLEQGRNTEQIVGLEPKTINRHLSFIGQLLREAKSRGHLTETYLDIGILRTPVKSRDQDERIRWSRDDLRILFSHPIWTGHDTRARNVSGTEILHDGLYWVPIIGYYTGARREEICGLSVDDVDFSTEISHVWIRENDFRGLKNLQSDRKIPFHSEILRLGFREYVAAIRESGHTLLFPDLAPADGESPYGEQFYNDFKPVLNKILPDHQKESKSFHSFRHGFNIQLRNNHIDLERREELMGHRIGAEAADRYVEPLPIDQKLSAIDTIDIVTSELRAAKINLRISKVAILRIPRRAKRACDDE